MTEPGELPGLSRNPREAAGKKRKGKRDRKR
jgi:hypothetical protein